MRYGAGEARDWAREHLRGVAGCVAPTVRSDFNGLNEAAIRHDVRLEKQLGFAGILLVSETGTTPEEMREFIDIALDESGGELLTILQASEPTLERNIELVQFAEQAGVDLVLPSFPAAFYPTSEDDVYDYYAALAGSTSLAMFVFAIHLWNFGRLHPSSFSPRLIGRLVDDCPNVVAIKNEIGAPGIAGISEVFERFNDRVVVTDPFEMNAPGWVKAYGMQFLGTSNYEYVGGVVPRMFDLLQQPDGYDGAMDLYWQVHPARQANMRIMGEATAGTSVVHRMMWKYQGWLNGFNGGPVRSALSGRVNDAQMSAIRAAIAASGLPVPDESDEAFFVGRNPA
ncbi:MAG: 1-pyrroline-4-hydroxy-2-carboxylate deaminase [Pseudonocardiales bacterium]|jgi:dihydrodipicolinate synthase/N-acetylneuraminate lyase|nr:1-pyrroline-4-hydroxy-2-carboxylate deaminase [Pseudonocardiales bacterium]